MQDVYGVTVKVGYQFAMRWMNAHVFYVKRRSLLAQRILETTMTMPLNHPNLEEDIVEKVQAVSLVALLCLMYFCKSCWGSVALLEEPTVGEVLL